MCRKEGRGTRDGKTLIFRLMEYFYRVYDCTILRGRVYQILAEDV